MGQALCPCMFTRRYTISKAGKSSWSKETRGDVTTSPTSMALGKHTDDNANSMSILGENSRNGPIKNSNTKNETGKDPAAQAASLEDRQYNNKAFQKPDIDPSNPQQQDAALKIQTSYRQYNAKKVVDTKRQEKAATKIQSSYRGYHDRQVVKELRESKAAENSQRDAEPDVEPVTEPEAPVDSTDGETAKIQSEDKVDEEQAQGDEVGGFFNFVPFWFHPVFTLLIDILIGLKNHKRLCEKISSAPPLK
ncbi:DgyrCDS3664 [Dimorphilus gyrociliatus]|uniref:DgyrCDS3664 n=1 Tax=Dimorphilus gyrociliatus TaxID=2664684 RepID=A0A7I8VEG7_9ANNE|nr:DgyrCDS3664 [Dimorphilus gyrociliatus]